MIGFNAHEGYIVINGVLYLVPPDQPLDNGFTLNYTRKILEEDLCPKITPLSVELCADYVINLYGLKSITSDEERARVFVDSRSK